MKNNLLKLPADLDAPASEERMRRLYEATPAMLHLIDLDGRLLMVSDLWLAKLGYSRQEVLGRPILDFLTPVSRNYSDAVVFPIFLETGHCENVPYQMICRNGDLMDALISAILERGEDGHPLYILTVIKDVTLQLSAERELTAERQKLSHLIEITQAATWEWNLQSGQARFDERFSQMFGSTREVYGSQRIDTWRALIHPEDCIPYDKLLETHFAGTIDRLECECRMRHIDGTWVWVLIHARLVTRTAAGEPEWLLGTLLDITARKRQEEELRESKDFLDRTRKLAGIGGWQVDLITGEIHWSTETYRIHSLDLDYRPTLDQGIDFYAPDARPVIRAAVEKAAAGGGGWDLELQVIRADGASIWVRTVGSAALSGGKPIRLMGSFQDISARVAERVALEKANESVAVATDSGGIGIWDWDLANDRLHWDSWMYRLYGMSSHSEAATTDLWKRKLHPEDSAAAEEALLLSLTDGRPYESEFRVVWDDGSIHFLRASGKLKHDHAGRAVRMIGASWDITESRVLAARLREQHELLRVTLQSIGDGVITVDAEARVTWLNPVAERMTGWSTADAIGLNLTEVFGIIHEKTRKPAENPVACCLTLNEVASLGAHTVLISRSGEEFGIEDSAAPILNDRGELLGSVLVFHDVTEQRRLTGEMTHRASHDSLTGLINRNEFEIRLRQLLHNAQTDKTQHGLLYLDLDQFKIINDTCGHAVGDHLLQQVSKLLAKITRVSDSLGRLGGDEFAVLLPHCPILQAKIIAQRICDSIDEFRFIHDNRSFRIGTSIGLVEIDESWVSPAAVLQAADTSCYAAKEAGRNRVHEWSDTDEMIRTRQSETQWAGRLAQALDHHGFALFAQRIQPLDPGIQKLHAEVLIRMLDSDGSLIPPSAFLPAAERFHLACRIDRWVLNQVILWMQSSSKLDSINCLNVNLSGQSIGDRAFHRWAIDALSRAGTEICTRLCFEVTETAAVTNLVEAGNFIEQVRAIGFHA